MHTIKLGEMYKPHDTVNVFLKKLCINIYKNKKTPNNLYVYYKRPFDDSVIYGFLCNVFKKASYIRTEVFRESFKHYFGKSIAHEAHVITRSEALKHLKALKIKHVCEPVCFHYMSEGFIEYIPGNPEDASEAVNTETWGTVNMFTYLMSAFQADEFYVVDETEASPYYFPFQTRVIDQQYIKNNNELEKKVEDVSVPETHHNMAISYVYIRGGDVSGISINPSSDLETLFDALKTSAIMPFAKFKTHTNVYYKIFKAGVQHVTEDWTKVPSAKDDLVVCKLAFDDKTFITVTIYHDLTYSVKVSFHALQNIKATDIDRLVKVVNRLLKEVQSVYEDAYVPLLPTNVLEHSAEWGLVRTVHLVAHMSTSIKSIKVNPANFQSIISTHLFPYFNLIETKDKTILHIQYKKVNNYTRIDNIASFIKNNYMRLSPQALVYEVMSVFNLDESDAQNEVDAWMSDHTIELHEQRKIYNMYNDNFVNIKLRLNNAIDVKYIVNGMTSVQVAAEIQELIAKLLVLSKRKKQDTEIKVIEETKEEISPTASPLGSEVELELDTEFAAALAALHDEYEEVPALPEIEAEEKTEETKLTNYFIRKLYEADQDLFNHPEIKYSSTCGLVDGKQPVVVSNEELEHIHRDFEGAITGSVKAGSTKEKYDKNNYICPRIWCPKSRVALSVDDFYGKYSQKCPYPDIEEDPIFIVSNKVDIDKPEKLRAALEKESYPFYLKTHKHPDRLCLPCCFTRKQEKKPKCVPYGDAQISSESEDEKAQKRYIKRANEFPLETDRYGVLSDVLVDYFGQRNTQGNLPNGTGAMTDKTVGFFRLGVHQSGQSYLDVVATMLNNPKIGNAKDLVNVIREELDILSYVSLENGRVMKMFVDTSEALTDENRSSFLAWLRRQKQYVIQMNLGRLVDAKENTPELLREFVIYRSYLKFLDYMANPKMIKDHIVCGDLINNALLKTVNIHRYNFVTLIEDFDWENNKKKDLKVYAACTSHGFDPNYPFVMILKQGRYYEPIVYIRDLKTHGWITKSTTREMSKLLDFVIMNCKRKNEEEFHKVIAFMKAIGHKVMYYVLDYGYQVCGLIVKDHLYVPLVERVPFWYDRAGRYVYISDVPKFKCFMKPKEISDCYKKVGKFLNARAFYKIQRWDATGFHIEKGYVPLRTPDVPIVFKTGLFVLTDIELEDRRAEIFKAFKKESAVLGRIHDVIVTHLVAHKDEIRFLLDSKNPLPLRYRKDKLQALLKQAGLELEETDTVHVYKYIMSYAYGKLYEQRLRRFASHDGELLIDHFDVLDGKLKDAIDIAENPYKVFMDIIRDIEQTYIFEASETDTFEDVLTPQGGTVKKPPKVWQTLLPGWQVIYAEKSYNARYLYNLFARIAKAIGHPFTDKLYKARLLNSIVDAWRQDRKMYSEVTDNPWLVHKKKSDLKDVIEAISDTAFYYPSYFDLKVMAELAGVNLVIIGRKTTKNPDMMQVIPVDSDFYVILQARFERDQHIDTFSLYTWKDKIIFRGGELPAKFADVIMKKQKVFNVVVDNSE